MRRFLVVATLLVLAACAKPLPAPVDYRITPLLERVLREVDPSPGPTMPANVYTVQRGDTLPRIAQRFGLDTIRLASVNDLRPPYNIRVGQRLTLPPLVGDQNIAVAGLAAPVEVERLPEVPAEATSGAPRERAIPAPTQARPTQPSRAQTPPAAKPAPSPPVTASLAPNTQPPAAAPPVGPPPPRAGSKFAWPVDGSLIATFGPQGGGRHSDGIDIRAAKGTPFKAADAGVVIYVGNEVRGFGNLLLVRHADGFVTAYAHADEITVKKGDRLRRGQTIGRVGTSGLVDDPRLHFEVRWGTEPLDPLAHLEARDRRLADRSRS
jgi:murein DD-endopeptidase MepM/ murein hydrolase activator NlpD